MPRLDARSRPSSSRCSPSRLRPALQPASASPRPSTPSACTGRCSDLCSPVAQRPCSPRRARWAYPRVPRRGLIRRDCGRIAHFLPTLVAVTWCRSSRSERRPATQRSPPHPLPGAKTDGPGSPSQTPVHAAPNQRDRVSGALQLADEVLKRFEVGLGVVLLQSLEHRCLEFSHRGGRAFPNLA